jgi:transposase
VGEDAVLSFTGSLKNCVALQPIDLRKSFHGLHGPVTERLGEDPRWPRDIEGSRVKLQLAPEALAMLTGGIDLQGAKMRPWHERTAA